MLKSYVMLNRLWHIIFVSAIYNLEFFDKTKLDFLYGYEHYRAYKKIQKAA